MSDKYIQYHFDPTAEVVLAEWNLLSDDEQNHAIGYLMSLAPRAVFEAAQVAKRIAK